VSTLEPRTRRDLQAVLPHSAPEETLVAAIERALSPPRPAKPVQYPGPILIVDDEPELLSTLKDFLEIRGCPVITAASGEEALDYLSHSPPTLVLLDIKLGGMDGLVTLKKIKELQPRLPVIMMTAVEDEELMRQAFAIGAYEYLTKPYNLAALQAILIHLKTLLMV
jgi:CheY-like chemotaxis protein